VLWVSWLLQEGAVVVPTGHSLVVVVCVRVGGRGVPFFMLFGSQYLGRIICGHWVQLCQRVCRLEPRRVGLSVFFCAVSGDWLLHV
jgi:hypothetical protein